MKVLFKQLFKVLVLIFIFPTNLTAQSINLKFGKVPLKDLKMTEYKNDTSAEAVILADYGHFDNIRFRFNRHLRIKILKKSGTRWANGIVNAPTRGSVKGITFNYENGKIVESELESESVYQEVIYDDLTVIRYFMPGAKVGSVIDIKYSFPGMPFEWYFQNQIPVIYSELKLDPTNYISFRKTMFGFERFFYQDDHRWIAKDVPALKPEPYMNSISNYITKFEFELISIFWPGRFYKDFATDWKDVNNTLLKVSRFGKEFLETSLFKAEAEEISKKYNNNHDKINAAFNFIKNHIKWNGVERLFTSKMLSRIYKKDKIGNSADVNLALIALLKKLDIEVYPVALSTRENGLLSPVYPSLSKLNYVIAYVKDDGKEYLLDATEKYSAPNILPERCLNMQGRLIDEKKSMWVDLIPQKEAKKTVMAVMKMDSDGNFRGNIFCNRFEHEALRFRNKFQTFNSEESFLEDMASSYSGITINDHSIDNIEEVTKPVKEKYEINFSQNSDKLGDIILFNPIFFEAIRENPFKNDERKFPLDFGLKSGEYYTLSMELPDGYIVDEMPDPVVLTLPEDDARFIYNITASDNKLQLSYKLEMNKVIFTSGDYPALRNFYNLVVTKLSEQITAKKRT